MLSAQTKPSEKWLGDFGSAVKFGQWLFESPDPDQFFPGKRNEVSPFCILRNREEKNIGSDRLVIPLKEAQTRVGCRKYF